jgi:hypothetical protein
MYIKAKDAPVDDHTVSKLFELTESRMNEQEPFSTTWDLRMCQVPSMSITWKCIGWALKHKRHLNEKNKRLVILNERKGLNKVVKLVLSTFGPSCPVWVGSDESEATNFMSKH